MERARACRCQQPGWVRGHDTGCTDGWLYIIDLCDCGAGR